MGDGVPVQRCQAGCAGVSNVQLAHDVVSIVPGLEARSVFAGRQPSCLAPPVARSQALGNTPGSLPTEHAQSCLTGITTAAFTSPAAVDTFQQLTISRPFKVPYSGGAP